MVIGRFLGFAAAWLVLTEGSIGGWPVALATIAAATAASVRLLPYPVGRWRVAGLLRFVPFFLSQSLAGGVDVAARAIRPSVAIEPRMIIFSLRLPEGPARRLFAGVAGLLPGTLAARLAGDEVTIHVLDTALPTREVLRRLEARTADVFGVSLNSVVEGDRKRM